MLEFKKFKYDKQAIPFIVMAKLLDAMFYCIHAAIYSFHNFENIVEITTANSLENMKITKVSK